MQNYGQPPGYQRPGSTASFAGQNQAPNPQWEQPQQQVAGGYNPGTYGAMPGGQQAYPGQPPPPPPKPQGFAAAVQQQQTQSWVQQSQQTASNVPHQQGGYPTQSGAQGPQQPYNAAAPPPPSATPGGSYFPPAQSGRPVSVYGASQVGSFVNHSQLGTPQQSTVMSPNEQQPAYIPPSLTGQGVQAYMPSNTNPIPGVYVPPPPDVPAWQHAQHAPLQGGQKKFRYTKPTVDPSFYAQGYQGVQPAQPPALPPHPVQYAQPQQGAPHPQQPPGPPPPDQFAPQQPQHQPQQQPYGNHYEQPGQPYQPLTNNMPYYPNLQEQQMQRPEQYQHHQGHAPAMASNMSKPNNEWEHPPGYGASNVSKPYNQWNLPAPAPAGQTYAQHHKNAPSMGQQPQWQPGNSQAQGSQGSFTGPQYVSSPGQEIQAPKPLGRTDTASSEFFAQPSPQSQPVSPIHNVQSTSYSSRQSVGLGRNGSVSSIALANLQAQREGSKTSSPRPAPPKLPTPPPTRDEKSKFSVLGAGGPSDWEHFGDDAEIDDEELYARKPRPVQLDSTEISAKQLEQSSGASSPSTHGWPSPATQTVQTVRRDTYGYQPTPPLAVAQLVERPASQSPPQAFVISDAAPEPLHISPKPNQGSRSSSTQRVMDLSDDAWQLSKQRTLVQSESQYQTPSVQQSSVQDDADRAAQPVSGQVRQQMPTQQLHQPPPVTTTFALSEGGMNIQDRTPTQDSSAWKSALDEKHAVELRVKDETLELLRADAEQEKADLCAQIKKLKLESENAMAQIIREKDVLQKRIESMETDAQQIKWNAEAAIKEKDLAVERLKEDVEGKEQNVEERDVIIADLRRELEAEKSKELVKITPTPAELIPDMDPWYAGSLERFIVMLRSEAGEPNVEDKIKTFKGFLKAESEIRGIEYHDAPLPASVLPTPEQKASNMSEPVASREELNVQVPKAVAEPPDEEDFEYSPGGRPLLARAPTMPVNDNAPVQQYAGPSTYSTTILTPTSSVDDDSNKTPVQSPPEKLPQPLYKAYVPPALFSTDSAASVHGQSIADVPAPVPLLPRPRSSEQRPISSSSTGKHHDEIFFGAPGQTASASENRSTSSDGATPDVSILAPLAFSSNRSVSMTQPSKKDPSEVLAELLPAHTAPAAPNNLIEQVRSKLSQLEKVTENVDDLTKEWDKKAAVTRKQNDSARRQRQELNEESNDEAFNNEELSYATLNVLEEEFKQKENDLKAKEDRDEYASYVEAVFDPVYDALQTDIKALMGLYFDAEVYLHTSKSGITSLEPSTLSTLASLSLLQDVHNAILERQDRVVAVVAERDKRYKKTEIQPLYAAGNISQMKIVAKHFDTAEKQAHIRALRDKAGRISDLVRKAEEVVVSAIGFEQGEIKSIVSSMGALQDAQTDPNLLSRATETLSRLRSSTKSLLRIFNALEMSQNAAVLDADIAQAKLEGDTELVGRLEEEKIMGEEKFLAEFARRVGVVEQGGEEVEVWLGERDKERRFSSALEEAKRRNGDV
ncbi:hypothetical protein BDU57DRAFT_596802 [Ampelomyces quisqualis]|uniref:Uncharacterized protein n=1 Tax=Ampelomyces quisqualis TaxID=50730 RepID=A0A6A5QLR1_AMPQU|nr:hypothetical protein BDU57DRAFT_596802 [Ampelomyces quisqualis]